MNIKHSGLILALSAALAACGGGGGGSGGGGGDTPGANEPRNVALQANGGRASASYNGEIAARVNDGVAYDPEYDDGERLAAYWQGNIPDDFVAVTFDRGYRISEFSFYVNTVMAQRVNNNGADPWVALSANGELFETIDMTEVCEDFIWYGRYRINCVFPEPVSLRAIRVRAHLPDNAHNFHVSEIEAIGTR